MVISIDQLKQEAYLQVASENSLSVQSVNLYTEDGDYVEVSNCKGTAGTAGTAGTLCGCAGTFGSLGTYGCGA